MEYNRKNDIGISFFFFSFLLTKRNEYMPCELVERSDGFNLGSESYTEQVTW